MKPIKFGSPHLDTPNSRYEFLKFAFKSVKINPENQIQNLTDSWGPHVSDIEQRRGLIGEELIDGEVTGDEVGTNMFPDLFRTYRYTWFARRVTGASSPASMAARR